MDTGLDVVETTPVGTATSFLFQNLTLSHRQRVKTVVTAVNTAGVERACETTGVLVDLTGPVATPHLSGIVWDGNNGLIGYKGRDTDWTWSTKAAFASWTRFEDPESGVNNYWVWAESMTGEPLSKPTWVHPSLTSWTMSIPTQRHLGQYRVVVEAENRAGSKTTYLSDGLTIDATSPVFTEPVEFFLDDSANIGLEPHIITSTSAKLRVTVTVEDPESGLTLCRYALGSYPDGSDITGVVTVPMAEVNISRRTTIPRRSGGEAACFDDGTCGHLPSMMQEVTTSVAFSEIINEDVPLINHLTFYAWVVCVNEYVSPWLLCC